MGWTEYNASHYKNGKVDRKAECDAYFMEGLNKGFYKVLKSSMVGSTYYAAVMPLKKSNGKDENGKYIYVDIPQDEQRIFAAIFLTSVNNKDYYNFAYKDMDESSGPFQCDCPKGILDLLTPTESEYANEWRKRCYENLDKKRNPNRYSKLPVGTVIKVMMPFDTNYFRQGMEVYLQKCTKWGSNRTQWCTKTPPMCRFTQGLMKALEGHYEVVNKGE